MLSLFKSKPKLSELIPTGYIDIHSHVLPGIDDGAKTMDDTQYLIEKMSELGFSKCITTPHTMTNVWDNNRESITAALTTVTTNLPQLSQKLNLSAASEYFLDENLMHSIQKDKLLTLKDNIILIEMSYLNAPLQLYDFLFELQLKGYRLVLAHPERYTFFHSNKKEYNKLKKAGCLFQLNLLATVGYYGKEVADVANYLLKENLYDFTGSDIHHKNHINAFQNKLVHKNHKAVEEIMNNNLLFK